MPRASSGDFALMGAVWTNFDSRDIVWGKRDEKGEDDMPMARTISITLRIFSGIPFLVGSAAFAWGIFCFLGGPEGRPWSAAALIAWGISWAVAAACAGLYLLLNRTSARARLVLLIAWAV